VRVNLRSPPAALHGIAPSHPRPQPR